MSKKLARFSDFKISNPHLNATSTIINVVKLLVHCLGGQPHNNSVTYTYMCTHGLPDISTFCPWALSAHIRQTNNCAHIIKYDST